MSEMWTGVQVLLPLSSPLSHLVPVSLVPLSLFCSLVDPFPQSLFFLTLPPDCFSALFVSLHPCPLGTWVLFSGSPWHAVSCGHSSGICSSQRLCFPTLSHCRSWDSEETVLFTSMFSGVCSGRKQRESPGSYVPTSPGDLCCQSAAHKCWEAPGVGEVLCSCRNE